MKNTKNLLLAIFIGLITLSSCKKEDIKKEDVLKHKIEGTWEDLINTGFVQVFEKDSLYYTRKDRMDDLSNITKVHYHFKNDSTLILTGKDINNQISTLEIIVLELTNTSFKCKRYFNYSWIFYEFKKLK